MNESKPCVAILGTGPGLGQALAREYGKRGHAVALAARRIAPLQALCAELAAEGFEAAAFAADFRRSDCMPRLFSAIRGRYGEVEALYYGPNAPEAFTTAAPLTGRRARVAHLLSRRRRAVRPPAPDCDAGRRRSRA